MCVGYGRSGPSMAAAADGAGFALMSSAWVVIIDLYVPPFSNLDKTIAVDSQITGTSARAAAFRARWPIVSTRWNASRDGGYHCKVFAWRRPGTFMDMKLEEQCFGAFQLVLRDGSTGEILAQN